MSQTQRLLLLAPPSMTRTPAFDRAEALAKAAQLPLHIVAFDYIEALAVAGLFSAEQMIQAREGYLGIHRQWLKQQAEHARKRGIVVTSEACWVQHPYQETLHYVNEMLISLIIKDAAPEPALKRIFFTPLDWQLLRDCPVPVHLVTQADHPRPRRILAIVDVLRSAEQDRVFNDQIVDAAVKLAEQCEAQLALLHVFDWSAIYATDMGYGVVPLSASVNEGLGKAQREVFAALAERHGVPPDHRHFIEAVPLPTICKFAKEYQADIIVMGTVHHSGLKALLGTTAELLLHQAPCSVLAIKPVGLARH